MDEGKEFTVNDPIHGMICFKRNSNPDEPEDIEGIIYDLINTKEFQRLRRIKQLGAVDYVYPGATHTRFAHSIGVAWLVYNAVFSLLKGWAEDDVKKEFKGYTSQQVKIATTCAGLLHDIGHGPFGHTLDERIYPKSHEEISSRIIKKESTDIFNVLKKYKNKFPESYIEDIIDLIYQDKSKTIDKITLLPVRDLISSQLDCDRLDYLMRDTYYCGTPIRIDSDYLIRNMIIEYVPFVGHKKVVFKEKAITAIEHYLLSRLLHYKQVAYHKTCVALEALLKKICSHFIQLESNNSSAIEEINKSFLVADDDGLNNFLLLDDSSFISYIISKHKKDKKMDYLMNCFLNRLPPKKQYAEINPDLFETTQRSWIKEFDNQDMWFLDNLLEGYFSRNELIYFERINYKDCYKVDLDHLDSIKEYTTRDQKSPQEPSKNILDYKNEAEDWIYYKGKDCKNSEDGIYNITEKSEIAKLSIGIEDILYCFRDQNFKEVTK